MSAVKMNGQSSRRERKKRETRQRLLECAWQQFLEKGYDETTVQDITEAADVAKGTFFNYFATKEAALDELALLRLDQLDRRVRADVKATSTGETPTIVARIKRMICALAGEFFPESDLPRHLLLARISAPIKHESAHRLGSIVRELVEQGQQSGEIRADVDADLIARLIMTSVFYHFMRAHPQPYHSEGSHAHARISPTVHHRRSEENGAIRNTQYAVDLEAKLIESVDNLLGGLAGPDWRQR
jgi:AcrR family transcriptional regulator